MDKVEKLWRSVQESGVPVLKLTFAEIEEILGFPMDHAFLSYKKNSLAYGYEVKKISLKEKTVVFCQRISKDPEAPDRKETEAQTPSFFEFAELQRKLRDRR